MERRSALFPVQRRWLFGHRCNEAQQIADLSLSVDSDRPRGLVAFTNARVITMNSARDVIDNGVVIVEDNRIVALGPRVTFLSQTVQAGRSGGKDADAGLY